MWSLESIKKNYDMVAFLSRESFSHHKWYSYHRE